MLQVSKACLVICRNPRYAEKAKQKEKSRCQLVALIPVQRLVSNASSAIELHLGVVHTLHSLVSLVIFILAFVIFTLIFFNLLIAVISVINVVSFHVLDIIFIHGLAWCDHHVTICALKLFRWAIIAFVACLSVAVGDAVELCSQ